MKDRLIKLCVEFKHKECEDLTYCDIDLLADYLIANDVTVNEWRPTSEPPKEDGEYLVFFNDGWGVRVFQYAVDVGFCDDLHITHWMPLPKPPKEVE